LKPWLALDTKGLRRCMIDWLVWWFTTTIARHYMHTLEMKRNGFIKNKVMEAIITRNVEKATFIPLTHVYQTNPWKWWNLGCTEPMRWNSHPLKYFVTHVNGHCGHFHMHGHVSKEYHSLMWNMVWITLWRVGSHVCGPMTYSRWYRV